MNRLEEMLDLEYPGAYAEGFREVGFYLNGEPF